MLIRNEHLEFKPALLPSIAALALIALFIGLGNWQLGRATEKRNLMTERDARSQAAPMELMLPLDEPEKWRYYKVKVSGTYDIEHQLLLDNQVYQGQAGYRVLTPLKNSSQGLAVLVDRGWVPLGASRMQRPDISLAQSRVRLSGTLYAPYGESYSLGSIDEGEYGWPRLIQFIDFELLSQRLGYPLAGVIVRLDADQANGFVRDWPLTEFTADRHIAYAAQWFAMALAVLILYILVNTKRVQKNE